MDERKKHGWPFWFAVGTIALLICYPLSYPPAHIVVGEVTSRIDDVGEQGTFGMEPELTQRQKLAGTIGWFFQSFYSPLFQAVHHSPAPIRNAYNWYLELWGFVPLD